MKLLWLSLIAICLVAINSVFSVEYDGPWRKAIYGSDTCWQDRSCSRVMTVSHGGDWDIVYPYDSFPAFQRAGQLGADAVKGDFRVSGDNVGMVMHSSPIEIYESFNCAGKYVEKMTAEQCKKCRMAVSDYYFISVPEFLSWADGNVNVMLCVKEYEDFPRAISTLIEQNATNRAFLEIGYGSYRNLVASNVPNWDKVFYVVQVDTSNDIMNLLNGDSLALSRAFLFEFHNWEEWTGDITSDISLVKKQGFRTFAATNSNGVTATVENHLKIYNLGFDVVYTYNLTNAITARQDVNTKNGIFPAR